MVSTKYIDLAALRQFALHFKGGGVAHRVTQWRTVTTDREILQIMASGLTLRLENTPKQLTHVQHPVSRKIAPVIKAEIQTLIEKQVIATTEKEDNDFFSPIFLRTNKDNSQRMILNLRSLNDNVDTAHFKMESIKNVLNMVTPNCYLASVDLKHAFYTIPVAPSHQKYLKFTWEDKIYQFLVMPNGYSDAMRLFTKILKPPFAVLREQGYLSVIYVDDTLLCGETQDECLENIKQTVALLQYLGFTIHPEKSVLLPTQIIEFLGFIIDTTHMTISLTSRKRQNIIQQCRLLLQTPTATVRQVAQMVGKMVATKEAIPLAPVYYRGLENAKIKALHTNRGNFEGHMSITPSLRDDLSWWITNIGHMHRDIIPWPIQKTLHTDASKQGWGAYDGITHTKGHWLQSEWEESNINVMELLAAKLAIFTLCQQDRHTHIRLMIDNTTAVAYINHMGGSKSLLCNNITKELWQWAESKNNWLSAAHIPGVQNIIADHESRHFNDSSEWSLSPDTFQRICNTFGTPDIDLFANRLNHKCPTYVSWHPDPTSIATDAFSIPWSHNLIYCFPPFSLIWKTLEKIRREKRQAIVILPKWPTQSWFPYALKLLMATPRVFSSAKKNLMLPHDSTQTHPMYPKMRMMAVLLSGEQFKQRTFLLKHKKYSWPHGGLAHRDGIARRLRNGNTFVVRNRLIHCKAL